MTQHYRELCLAQVALCRYGSSMRQQQQLCHVEMAAEQ